MQVPKDTIFVKYVEQTYKLFTNNIIITVVITVMCIICNYSSKCK